MGIEGEYRLIDLHCDTITRCHDNGLSLVDQQLHLCLDCLPANIRLCQAAAIYIPDDKRGKPAQDYFLAAYETYQRLTGYQQNRLATLRDLRYIDKRLDEKPIVFFLTVEGGSVLAGDLAWVDKIKECGVKMMTLTWNGANEICGGARSQGEFTPFGRKAVARMEELGIAVDVSHINDESFWQLCEFASEPFMASHSNARAVCPNARNLTDEMFGEIVRRGGVVGLNYYREFIVSGGESKSFDDLLRHLHHFLELGGEDTVALGSDFDGADMPPYLQGVEALPNLIEAVERSGIAEPVIQKLLYGNACRYLAALEKDV